MLETIFLGSNAGRPVQIVISATVLYVAVVGFIRLSGKRSTSQMNNFDWIVTVALGSLVGSGIILKDVGVLEVMLAVGTLLGLQYLITWSVVRSDAVGDLVKPAPRLLVHKGQRIDSARRDERISERELMAALRDRGIVDLSDVTAVVLESDATFSVITKPDPAGSAATLEDVRGYSKHAS